MKVWLTYTDHRKRAKNSSKPQPREIEVASIQDVIELAKANGLLIFESSDHPGYEWQFEIYNDYRE